MKNNNSLIVGMGIGQLYKSVAQTLGMEAVTVDMDIAKKADFPRVTPAVIAHDRFTIGHVCTPNFTHDTVARSMAPYCKILFIEKPGLKDAEAWRKLVRDFPDTRIMMVKNNQFRTELPKMQKALAYSDRVQLSWINKNRIPQPGSWFTTRDLSFGGVGKDLMPHLLSFYTVLAEWREGSVPEAVSLQRYTLDTIDSTDYGVVKKDGVYDVEDFASVRIVNNHYETVTWDFVADWKNDKLDKRDIEFYNGKDLVESFELGLCPEEAYANMVKAALHNQDNDSFWDEQLAQDLWIHNTIGRL